MFDALQDGVEVHPCDSVAAFIGEDEAAVAFGVHEEVLGQYGRTHGLFEDGEVGLLVGVAVGSVDAHSPFGEGCTGMPVEDFGVVVCGCLAPAGPYLPARAAAGVGVDGEEQTVIGTVHAANMVRPVCAGIEWDVCEFRNEDVEGDAFVRQQAGDAAHDVAVELVFEELRAVGPYGRAFARRFFAVAVVEENAECHADYLIGSSLDRDAAMADP